MNPKTNGPTTSIPTSAAPTNVINNVYPTPIRLIAIEQKQINTTDTSFVMTLNDGEDDMVMQVIKDKNVFIPFLLGIILFVVLVAFICTLLRISRRKKKILDLQRQNGTVSGFKTASNMSLVPHRANPIALVPVASNTRDDDNVIGNHPDIMSMDVDLINMNLAAINIDIISSDDDDNDETERGTDIVAIKSVDVDHIGDDGNYYPQNKKGTAGNLSVISEPSAKRMNSKPEGKF